MQQRERDDIDERAQRINDLLDATKQKMDDAREHTPHALALS